METDDGETCIYQIMKKPNWNIKARAKRLLRNPFKGEGKFLKKLDYYIIKKFLGTYVFAIALIISIAVVFDFNEKMDRFMSHNAPWKAIVFNYYLNFIPYFANLFSPLFVFIAVIFFTSKLAENSEIIAMFSTGMSFKRMLRPYMVSAAIIAIVTFALGSYIRTQFRAEVDASKPAEVVERIVEGKMAKFYEESVLLEQPFIKDEGVRIKDLITQTIAKLGENIVVRRFSRLEVGG